MTRLRLTRWLSHWITESLSDQLLTNTDTYWHTNWHTYWHTYWHLLTPTDHLSLLQDQIPKRAQDYYTTLRYTTSNSETKKRSCYKLLKRLDLDSNTGPLVCETSVLQFCHGNLIHVGIKSWVFWTFWKSPIDHFMSEINNSHTYMETTLLELKEHGTWLSGCLVPSSWQIHLAQKVLSITG